jgi:hypothetical protein
MFQRGCLDVFILRGMPDVGPFTHLIIGHDGAGAHPGMLHHVHTRQHLQTIAGVSIHMDAAYVALGNKRSSEASCSSQLYQQ